MPQGYVSSYQTLRDVIISITGNSNPDFTNYIDNDIRLGEARNRNLRLPLMKSDPEQDARYRFTVDADGRIDIPGDMLEMILPYQLEPLIQYNRTGFQEVQREAYENRYGAFGASSDVWTSYQGEFGEIGTRYQLTPRPPAGTLIYMYYYRDWNSLGPDGFQVAFTGSATGAGSFTLAGIPVSFSGTDGPDEIAQAYVDAYNDLASTGSASVVDGVVTVTDEYQETEAAVTDNGITATITQIIVKDNFLILQAPDLYQYATLHESFRRLRNEEQAAYYLDLWNQAHQSLMEADTLAEGRGGRRAKRSRWSPRRRGSLRS